MSEPYTYNPSSAESRNIFTASCVESVASALQQPADEVYRRMARVNLIDDYIIPCYEVLHSESRENVTKDLIYTLELWEQKQGLWLKYITEGKHQPNHQICILNQQAIDKYLHFKEAIKC